MKQLENTLVQSVIVGLAAVCKIAAQKITLIKRVSEQYSEQRTVRPLFLHMLSNCLFANGTAIRTFITVDLRGPTIS